MCFFSPIRNDPLCLCVSGQKISANIFVQSFPRALRVMDVRTHPTIVDVRTKSVFSCGPGVGEKLFDPWASGRKDQECRREIRTKKIMFLRFCWFPVMFKTFDWNE